MPVTRPFTPRILLAFDFDGTLATDSLDAILGLYGLTRAEWERDYADPLGEGWDEIIRRGVALIRLGEHRGEPLSLDHLAAAAADVRLFDGVLAMPERLRQVARDVHPRIEVEFVVVSSGYAEVIAASPIAGAFGRLFASTFQFDGSGRALWVKRIVSHPQKALYLDAIAKDLDLDGANAPEAAGRDVDEHRRHVPFDQMVYVGDGASDLHAFGFMRSVGGLAIAVDPGGFFSEADAQRRSQRVDAVGRPDYSPGSDLLLALEHAVRASASRIALRAVNAGP